MNSLLISLCRNSIVPLWAESHKANSSSNIQATLILTRARSPCSMRNPTLLKPQGEIAVPNQGYVETARLKCPPYEHVCAPGYEVGKG